MFHFDKIKMFFKSIKNIKSINYNYKNEIIIFNNIKCPGATSLYFVDEKKRFFLKIPVKYFKYDILKREIYILKKLSKYEKYFPKIIDYNDYGIITEYIGDILNTKNIPKDINVQINEIINILKSENIKHCDIKNDELLVKNNILYIVDWGWGKVNDKFDCDIGLSKLIKPYYNKNSDLQCILQIINKLSMI